MNSKNTSPSSHPYHTQAFSLAGLRAKQEDSFLIADGLSRCLVLVADGLGGHAAGDFASRTCARIYEEEFKKLPATFDPAAFLRQTAYLVNKRLLEEGEDEPQFRYCGTTVTGFLVQEGTYYLINIGDSRVYGFDGQEGLVRLTQDHSYVQELLDKGQITEEEAFVHPRRNMVTSSLGTDQEYLKVDISGPRALRQDQVLLAFSDGVHDTLRDEDLLPLLQKGGPHLAQEIAEAALNAGGTDNITVCLLSHSPDYASRTA